MKLLPVFAALFALAGCATSGSYSSSPIDKRVEDSVSERGGHFGWDGVYLGDTQAAVEQVLKKPVTISPDGFPTCGSFSSDVMMSGRSVNLQWSSDHADATVQSIMVKLPASELDTPQADIADRMKKDNPRFKELHDDDDSIELGAPDGQAILIKNHKEHFLLVTHAACIEG